MLVLTRKPEESIIIGDGIIVKVLEIRGNKVKLGIEGKRNIPIMRGELRRNDRTAEASEFWVDAADMPQTEPVLV